MKKCSKCGLWKSKNEFPKNLTTKDKLSSWCNLCYKLYRKLWYDGNKEKIREHNREYCKKNRKKIRENAKRWYKKNREKIKEHSRLYYQKNKEKINIKSEEWRRKNPERCKAIAKRSRAKRRGAIGSHTLGEWKLLKKRYRFCCPMCKKCEPEIKLTEDHRIPLSKGGSDYIENIRPLCLSCNSKKGAKVIGNVNVVERKKIRLLKKRKKRLLAEKLRVCIMRKKKNRKKKLTSDRDEAILYMRRIRRLTLQEIADIFKISRQRIKQILDKNSW